MERGQLPDFGKIMKLAQKVASQIEKPSEFNEKRVLSEEEMSSAISKITKSVSEVVNPMMIQELHNNKKDKQRVVPISKQKSKITFEEIKEESGIEEIETVNTEPEETKEIRNKKSKRLVEIESEESEEDSELPLRTKDMTFTLTVSLEELYNGCRKKIAMRRQKIEDDKYVEEKKKLSIKKKGSNKEMASKSVLISRITKRNQERRSAYYKKLKSKLKSLT